MNNIIKFYLLRGLLLFCTGIGLLAEGCSNDNDDSSRELASKINLTLTEYYNEQGTITVPAWERNNRAGLFVTDQNAPEAVYTAPIQSGSQKSLFLFTLDAPQHATSTVVAFWPSDANLRCENGTLKTVIPTMQTGFVTPILVGKADADEARSPYVIETISFNIRVDNPSDGDNIWKNRKQAVITMINRQQPTIMGLQEAQPHQITYLAKQCPEYAWYGLGRDTGEAPPKTETYASEECMAIFFQTSIVEMLDKGTFWLSETPNIPSKGWDANYNRSCTWALFRQKTTGKRFYFFNTHLDNSGTVARKESIKLIINKIEEVNSEQLPVFLTADFNSDTDESCFNPLHQVMKDARATAPVTDQEATYNGYKTSGTRKLDHIFYDNGCVASIFQTLKENYGAPYISDHYPVRTCFVLF